MNNETPKLAVDCIVFAPDAVSGKTGIVLIKRKNPPYGYALPGGYVDVGETVKHAASREMREELNLDVQILDMHDVYDDPNRDPRQHTVSVVFVAKADKPPKAGDDAKKAFILDYLNEEPPKMAFDHRKILDDFFRSRSLENIKCLLS